MFLAISGFGSGAIHAVSGPDHVLSLAPLAVGQKRSPWRIGLSWGIGHSLGTFAVAIAVLFLLAQLDLEALSSWSERLAGLALIGLGASGLRSRTEHELQKGTPLFIGLIHGVTGAAALLLLLPAIASAPIAAQLLFLLGFSAGSSLAMAGMTAAMSRFKASAQHLQSLRRGASLLSMCLGALWLLQAL